MSVVKGILTKGLGGNATAMMLGSYTLGNFGVVVEVIPPQTGSVGGKIYIPTAEDQIQTIRITVTYRNRKWTEIYKVSKIRANIIIHITKIINTISTNISVAITKVRKLINLIRIK